MDFFAFAIAALFLLALIDLSVGVSNDAVNFLNSAIGSRVATRRTILIVASLGILVGALFSSGIMEVARKGIFNPEMFTFADVMIVFLAVMIADVLLLDLFNTFGLPTSTTVSIVFELLGAATAVAIIHVTHNPEAPPFFEFINHKSALAIISGILLSVAIAFIVGAFVQFISRLLFTFEDSSRTVGVRVVWSALALTIISDFLFIKGLKGASFISGESLQYVQEHTLPILALAFIGWLLVALVIQSLGRNPLVFVVLAGTFALAMAFASNDLVNFIGVPLAGIESWRAWSASGVGAEDYLMHALREPVQGNSLILLGAGVVMAMTLWFSSKARSVTKTEVTLGRQDEGTERFRPGPVSRSLVRLFLASSESLHAVTPAQWRTEIARRFEREDLAVKMHDAPAFDLVRASVNLAVASVLIALATSLKLPLSTTFVSFMVAMGTSLADRAWGRDSATYRVAGVLSVLSGWFITAAAAFLLAALFAVLLSIFGGYGLAALLVLVAFTLYHSFRFHGLRSRRDERSRAKDATVFEHQMQLLQAQMSDLLKACSDCVDLSIRGLLARDRALLSQADSQINDVQQNCRRKELTFVRVLKRVQPSVDDRLLGHLEVLACQQDLFQSVAVIVSTARSHVLNAHEQLTDETSQSLARFNEIQRKAVQARISHWASGQEEGQEEGQSTDLIRELDQLLTQATRAAVGDLYGNVRPVRFTTLILTLLTELADFVREIERAHGLWAKDIRAGDHPPDPDPDPDPDPGSGPGPEPDPLPA